MIENCENMNRSKVTAKQWLLMMSSYMSAIIFFSFLSLFICAILIVIISNIFATAVSFEIFSAVLDIFSFLYNIGAIVIVVMFFYCMIGISRNSDLTSNEKSNWRWFLVINWIFALPEYYETFLAKPENKRFQRLRTLLRPRSLMFYKP